MGGGIVLVPGVRLLQLLGYIALPTTAAIAIGLAIPLKQKASQAVNIDNPALAREIKSVQQQSQLLVAKATELRPEAQQMLTSTTQLELFAAIEYAWDLLEELPNKVMRSYLLESER